MNNIAFNEIAAKFGAIIVHTSSKNESELIVTDDLRVVPKIRLGVFDDVSLKLISLFHEIGHLQLFKMQPPGLRNGLCGLSLEGAAWEIGLLCAYQCGYVWQDQHPAMEFARTYLTNYQTKPKT